MLCLLIRHPALRSGPAWHRLVRWGGHIRTICRRGHTFSGREGLTHVQSTGWYQPVAWVTPHETSYMLADCAWESELPQDANGDTVWPDDTHYLSEVMSTMCGTPDDFPGLAEHYPELVAMYHATLASADKCLLDEALALIETASRVLAGV